MSKKYAKVKVICRFKEFILRKYSIFSIDIIYWRTYTLTKMRKSLKNSYFETRNKSCYGLSGITKNSMEALVTDPPYGIGFQNYAWDKALPDPAIWQDALRVLKPGAFGLVFSSVRLMHRLMVALEDAGFMIKDVIFWSYLNGMPKSRDISLAIDKELGMESEVVGSYRYVQGYRKGASGRHPGRRGPEKGQPEDAAQYGVAAPKVRRRASSALGRRYRGAGLGIKPAYEPIIMVQKPRAAGLNVAQNMVKYGTGALNLEETRIPLAEGEAPVGHNPHPLGRVCANHLRTEPWQDGYDKFFMVPKVRQHKDDFNHHPTLKPVALMEHLVKLVSFEGQTVLDPFAGSGSTGVAALQQRRQFVGYEKDSNYYKIMNKRLRSIDD